MNKITLAIAVTTFAAGVLLGSAHAVDAGHDKPCPTITRTPAPTVKPTATLSSGPICAQLVGGKCKPPSFPTRAR